jgi:hypothetical protein
VTRPLDLCGAPSCDLIITMSPRFMPYAATPGRALLQAAADFMVALWLVLWFIIGRLVHNAIAAFAEVGRTVQHGANGIAGNLDSAGNSAAKIPLVGDNVRAPLRAAGSAARDLAGAGHGLDQKATTLAIILSLAVAIPPALAVFVPWLLLRLRFARRAGAAATLASTPGGDRLLALRALTNRPLSRVLAVSADPVEGWRTGDPETIRLLAALELRAVGLK